MELQHSGAARPVTVSIVSHGQFAMVEKLLGHLERTSAHLVAEVVITCNIPEPHEWRKPPAGFPVRMLHNARPKGFGANHNAAFEHCHSPWFLVLNPDIEWVDDPLEPLLACSSHDTGLLAPRVSEPGKSAPEPHRALLTPLEILHRRLGTGYPPQEPQWVAGMFMLLRAKAFFEVGGFDSKFFMYVEDADLCARLKLAGWGIVSANSTTVLHEAQRASRRRLRPLLWHLTSLLRWYVSTTFWRALLLQGKPR